MTTPTFTFSKQETQQRLEALPHRCRIAFGLSCCERMLPNYSKFKQEVKWGDERPLIEALDELWECVEGKTTDKSMAKRLWDRCDKVMPDADDFSVLMVGPAQDACLAICCILDYVQGENPERIAQASSYAIDTLDLYVQELMDGFQNTPRGVPFNLKREEQIRLHPLMQCELARQDADLKLLAANPDFSLLKTHWRAPTKSNIGLPD